MSDLTAKNLTVARSGKTLLHPTDLSLSKGELVVLLGPNGSGKTTLLRSLVQPSVKNGCVQLGDRKVSDFSATERARHIAYLPQTRPLAWPNRVRDIVALGRLPHGGKTGKLSETDSVIIEKAIADCSISHLADRTVDTLSGGELARMHCARVFATQADFIIADEPVAALDPLHQYKVMQLFQTYAKAGGGVLVVLHDIQLAARFADRLLWMKDGCLIANGPPSETLTQELLKNVFQVNAKIDQGQIDILGPAIE